MFVDRERGSHYNNILLQQHDVVEVGAGGGVGLYVETCIATELSYATYLGMRCDAKI